MICNKKFQLTRKSDNLPEIIFKKYIFRRRTLSNLVQDYHRSLPWIKSKIFDHEPPKITFKSRPVVIVCYATFYGKNNNH